MLGPVTVREILARATRRLAHAGCDTPALDAEVLLAHTLLQERTWLYMYPEQPLAVEQLAEFDKLLERRVRREPVAYIVGSKEFFGLDFQVNQQVLIPRPETELLVETALEIVLNKWPVKNAKRQPQLAQSKFQNTSPAAASESGRPAQKSKIDIVDVGTGSGCIAVALATKLPEATILAIDASADALDLARQNARRHNVVDRITFLSGNLLQSLDRPVDLMVSNPPYVSHSELKEVSPEVGQYEPQLALDGGEDGLEVIRQLLPQAKEKLSPGGALLLEIGSRQGQAAAQLARDCFPMANVLIKQDLAGLDRLLSVEIAPN